MGGGRQFKEFSWKIGERVKQLGEMSERKCVWGVGSVVWRRDGKERRR